jgi:uncharacterized protein YprB with RNaseH-like and TPR domain
MLVISFLIQNPKDQETSMMTYHSETIVFLDIETIPTSKPEIMERVAQNMKPPGNMSKPETISAWMNNPANIKEALEKTALSGLFGQIFCLSFCSIDSDVMTLSGDEKDILRSFQKIIEQELHGGETIIRPICGHNIEQFDAPFISKRMMCHGLGPLFDFELNRNQIRVIDTSKMFSAGAYKDFVSLVDLCIALGVDKPMEAIDGSQVYDAYLDGREDEIVEHCESDVIATRECYLRMTRGWA